MFHIWSGKVPRSTPVCCLSVPSKDPRLTITQRGRKSHNCIKLILHLLLYGRLSTRLLSLWRLHAIYLWLEEETIRRWTHEKENKNILWFAISLRDVYTGCSLCDVAPSQRRDSKPCICNRINQQFWTGGLRGTRTQYVSEGLRHRPLCTAL